MVELRVRSREPVGQQGGGERSVRSCGEDELSARRRAQTFFTTRNSSEISSGKERSAHRAKALDVSLFDLLGPERPCALGLGVDEKRDDADGNPAQRQAD